MKIRLKEEMRISVNESDWRKNIMFKVYKENGKR